MKKINLSDYVFKCIDEYWKLEIEDVLKYSTSEECQNERWEFCKGCEHYDEPEKGCKECGCWLPHKIKDPFAYCPIHKWDSDDRQWKKEHYDIIEKELRKKYPELDVWKDHN